MNNLIFLFLIFLSSSVMAEDLKLKCEGVLSSGLATPKHEVFYLVIDPDKGFLITYESTLLGMSKIAPEYNFERELKVSEYEYSIFERIHTSADKGVIHSQLIISRIDGVASRMEGILDEDGYHLLGKFYGECKKFKQKKF